MRKRKDGAVSTSLSAEERESHAETLFAPIGNEGDCKAGILLLHDSFALIFPYPTETCLQFLFLTLVQTRQDKVEVSNLYSTARRKEEKCWGSPPQSPDGALLFFCAYTTKNATDPTSSVSSCLRKFILYIMSYTDRTFGQKNLSPCCHPMLPSPSLQDNAHMFPHIQFNRTVKGQSPFLRMFPFKKVFGNPPFTLGSKFPGKATDFPKK